MIERAAQIVQWVLYLDMAVVVVIYLHFRRWG